jgi:hypothetical protein
MSDLKAFIRRWAVLSKTSGQSQVADYEGTKYVFLSGYPMTYRTFVMISLKGIFGGTVRLTVAEWETVHKEILELTDGLALEIPNEERPGFAIVQMIRRELKITMTNLDVLAIVKWLKEVEDQVHNSGELEIRCD